MRTKNISLCNGSSYETHNQLRAELRTEISADQFLTSNEMLTNHDGCASIHVEKQATIQNSI